jgi:YVTN family beta-propeller protein
MKRFRTAALCLVLLTHGAGAQAAEKYFVQDHTTLSGPVRWDYLFDDGGAHRLYLTRGDHVDVVDTRTMKTVGTIPDSPGVHGVALAHDAGKGYVTNGKSGSVGVFDLKTLKPIATITTAPDSDGIVYDVPSHLIAVASGDSASMPLIDTRNDKVVATVALPGKPEFLAVDGKGHAFVNINDKNLLVKVDLATRKVLAAYDLAPTCTSPAGLAIDAAVGHLFVGCHNQVMAVVDGQDGRILASLPIGKSNDAVVFDTGRRLAFASNGDGTLTIIGLDKGGTYAVRQTVTTMPASRTLALDQATHRIYLAGGVIDHIDPPTTDHPHPRPQFKEGSFMVITVDTAPHASK